MGHETQWAPVMGGVVGWWCISRTTMTKRTGRDPDALDRMPRLGRVGCGVCAALVLLASGCVASPEPSNTIYHRDPSTVREQYQSWLLFAYLGGALQSLASQEFGLAEEQLTAVEAQRAHLPSGLVDLATRYTELCRELANTIESLYESLERAEGMLAENDVSGVGPLLETCSLLLGEAREQLEALEKATNEVMTVLRRSGSGTTAAQLNEARESIDEAVRLLAQLTLEYEQRTVVVKEAAEGKQTLVQPDLTLGVDRDAAWVGEAVAVTGVLSAASAPLAGRELIVVMDGVEVAVVKSDDRGAFCHVLELPYEYIPLRVVRVAYRPEGADLAQLQAVTSSDVILTVRFHQSEVTVEPPGKLYPGLPLTLTGLVESTGSTAARQVEAMFDEKIVGDTVTAESGAIQCTIVLPEDAPRGHNSLQLLVHADDDNATGPAVEEMEVEVVTVAPRLELDIERLLFVPALSLSLPRQLLGGDFVRVITVSGQVQSPLPLGTVSMSADCDGRQIRWEQQAGAFVRDVPVEVSVWSMGLRTVNVRVSGQEPWHHPGEAHATLLLVNLFIPLVWFMAMAAALLLGVALRRLRWSATPPGRADEPIPDGASAGLSATGIGVSMSGGAVGPRSLVVGLYYQAVALLHVAFGTTLRREMTLREYLASVADRITVSLQPFAGLTALAERALYGRREPDSDDVSAGRDLLEMVKPEPDDDIADDDEEPR